VVPPCFTAADAAISKRFNVRNSGSGYMLWHSPLRLTDEFDLLRMRSPWALCRALTSLSRLAAEMVYYFRSMPLCY
jgi:hypothetical protein